MPASGNISSSFSPLEIPLEIGRAPFKAAGIGIMALASRSMAAKGGIWTATKSRTAVQNAFSHWKKHAAEFPEYLNATQYVQGAKNFLSNSPKGTLTKARPNGDILKYHPDSNTFGVMNSSGIPRTMFRPTDGMKYWLRQ